MPDPQVDVVIPLHRADRPVGIAVESTRSELQGLSTRTTVVLHNMSRADYAPDFGQNVRLLACNDGVPSPSGPRNVGLEAATASYVLFLDSDDRLAPDCLRLLHEAAVKIEADVILPSIRVGTSYVGTPLVHSRRVRPLDPVRHQLFLRSHVPALLRREYLVERSLRYPEGVRTGEDLVLMAQLYASARVGMSFDAVYCAEDPGDDRLSTMQLPPADELEAIYRILRSDWFAAMELGARLALVRRILAVNLASGWRSKVRRGQSPSLCAHIEARDLAIGAAPGVLKLLSVRDRATLRFSPVANWRHRVLLSRTFALAPSSWAGFWSTYCPWIMEFRSYLVRVRRRRRDFGPSRLSRRVGESR